MGLQEVLRLNGCHAARAGGSDGLSELLVLHIARGEDTINIGGRGVGLGDDIPLQTQSKKSR